MVILCRRQGGYNTQRLQSLHGGHNTGASFFFLIKFTDFIFNLFLLQKYTQYIHNFYKQNQIFYNHFFLTLVDSFNVK